LIQVLKDKKIHVLDLVPVFSRLDDSLYYFEHEGHMTELGHQVVARNIYRAILPYILNATRETQELVGPKQAFLPILAQSCFG
jgi:hypothetical protein